MGFPCRWHKEGKGKQPYYITFGKGDEEGDVMYMAGLFDSW